MGVRRTRAESKKNGKIILGAVPLHLYLSQRLPKKTLSPQGQPEAMKGVLQVFSHYFHFHVSKFYWAHVNPNSGRIFWTTCFLTKKLSTVPKLFI